MNDGREQRGWDMFMEGTENTAHVRKLGQPKNDDLGMQYKLRLQQSHKKLPLRFEPTHLHLRSGAGSQKPLLFSQWKVQHPQWTPLWAPAAAHCIPSPGSTRPPPPPSRGSWDWPCCAGCRGDSSVPCTWARTSSRRGCRCTARRTPAPSVRRAADFSERLESKLFSL